MDTLKWWLVLIMVLSVTVPVHAAAPICLRLDWDYPPMTQPPIGSFFVYVSDRSGVYPIVPGKPFDSRPRVIVDVYPTMLTTVSCAALKLTGAGPWYVVVTAVAGDMSEESDPSDERIIGTDGVPVPPPKPRPPAPVTPPPVVTLPPPLAWTPRPVVPQPPGPSGGSGRLTDTDVWMGVGATPPPLPRMDVPGAPPRPTGKDRLTDAPTWRGQP